MGYLVKKQKSNGVYYAYQESFRVKVDSHNTGKKRGTGRSKVCTRSIHLGSAESIVNRLQQNREPISVSARAFGLVSAAYQTAREIGLQDILQKHMCGQRADVPLWVYFFVSIVNRLDHATSKNRMGEWLDHTILPELLGLDPQAMSSKNFWYAADDVLSEKELQAQRNRGNSSDDSFAGLGDDVFGRVEADLFERIDQMMGLSPAAVCYDTTNFYTYIEEPKRSELANTCHSKSSRHHLRHVGLLMAVEKSHGVPLLSQVYRANRHDSKVFSAILADLVVALKKMSGDDSDLVIVLDKGNNSSENFNALSGLISWVGALVPSHYPDLMDLDLTDYHGFWKDLRYYRYQREVMGIDCAVILIYNPATRRKQEHCLRRGIDRLKALIQAKWSEYKRRPKAVTQGIRTLQKDSPYGNLLDVSVSEGELHITEIPEAIEARMKPFGKSLVFSDMTYKETGYLIDTYHDKHIIEDDFQLLKDPAIIRFQPIRHWTDTKIRAYAFCCVISMTLMRVMQWKAAQAGYKLTPKILKEELSDIREVVMVYSPTEAKRKITQRSGVQKELWKVFKLNEIEHLLALH
jgi:transposase